MRLFRRKAGRHELGAAVTAIPAAPLPAAPAPAVPVRPAQVGAIVRTEPAGPRVELGFRDGSTAALAPESAQAKALTEIASALTRRD